MEESCLIRKALLSDAANIAEVHFRAWQQAYFKLLPTEVWQNISLNKFIKSWEKSLQQKHETWVFQKNESILGFGTLIPTCKLTELEIKLLYIDPEYWRSGIGRLIGNKLLSLAQAANSRTVVVKALCNNLAANKFYQRLGFTSQKKIWSELAGIEVEMMLYSYSFESELAAKRALCS